MAASVGISSTSDDSTAQLRPPSRAVPMAYGMRTSAPTSAAVAPTSSLSPVVKP